MSIRAFFAIEIPLTIQKTLEKNILLLRHTIPHTQIFWSKLSYLHVTLQFLKALKQEDIEELITRVEKQLKNISAFYLELGQLELFPSPTHPHIISLRAGPHTILSELAKIIGGEIAALNYPIEPRPFRGHLTLARLKDFYPPPNLFEKIYLPPLPKVFINKITLLQSQPKQNESHYSPLAYFSLNKTV